MPDQTVDRRMLRFDQVLFQILAPDQIPALP